MICFMLFLEPVRREAIPLSSLVVPPPYTLFLDPLRDRLDNEPMPNDAHVLFWLNAPRVAFLTLCLLLLCRFRKECATEVAKQTAEHMVPGALGFGRVPGSSLTHNLVQEVQQALFGIAVQRPRFVKVCLTTTLIASYGLGMIKADEGMRLWTKLAGLRAEDPAMIHAQEKADEVAPIGVLLLKVLVLLVLLEIDDEIGDGERAVALLVSIHAPPDAALILFGEDGTVDVQERTDFLFAGCHVQASFLLDEWPSRRYHATWRGSR
jgi:hypothetical protein